MRVLAYATMQLKARLAYREDLVLRGLGELLVTAAGLVVVLTIYHHVPTVRGWSVHEVLLCWGIAEAGLGLFWTVFRGLHLLNRQYILGGELDRVMLRPMDPLVQVLLDHLAPESLAKVVLGLAVVAQGAWGLGLPWGPLQWVLLPVMVLSATAIVGGFLTGLSAVGFWMQHQGSAIGLAYQVTVFSRYPVDLYPRLVGLALLTVLPFAFAGFVPATLYMDRPDWLPLALATPLVGAVCLGAGWGFWRFSLKRYASSGH